MMSEILTLSGKSTLDQSPRQQLLLQSVMQEGLQPDLKADAQAEFSPGFPDSDYDIRYLVHCASKVIAPLGPIATFAARNPWAGLEQQSFDQAARWLKDIHGVDIYPGSSMLQKAQIRGDLNPEYLEDGLQHWLDMQSFHLPREVSVQFCRAALQLNALPSSLVTSPELRGLANKFHDLKLPLTKRNAIQTHNTLHTHDFIQTRNPVQTYSGRLQRQGMGNVMHELNCHMIKWCKLYLDTSKAAWSLPNRGEGFYCAFRRLSPHDHAFDRSVRQQLKDLPTEASVALKMALSNLRIPKARVKDYLAAHLLCLPGWAGMMLWRSQQSTQEEPLLLEYLAVRVSVEWALVQPVPPLKIEQAENEMCVASLIAAWVHWGGLSVEEWSRLSFREQKERLALAYSFDEILRRRIWLEAWEKTYETELKEIISLKKASTSAAKPVLAQFSFCIDVRSEPFRRKLEQSGPFETFGMAGFFGVPIETSELGEKHFHSSLPVMQRPKHRVKEFTSAHESRRYQERWQTVRSTRYTFKKMKQNLLANLLLPEVSGPWLCLQMLLQSFFPRRTGRAFRQLGQSWLCKPSTELSLDNKHMDMELPVGFSNEEKVHYVLEALKMMGLTSHFAPLVVICGHGSHSTNNPYAAALDCGACGGKSGAFNARVLAALCNLSDVRENLKKDGIFIPEDTVFAAAEHITTTNELRFLDVPELSNAAREAMRHVQAVLTHVSHEVSEEQLSRLPKLGDRLKNPKAQLQRFAEDWSEVRPEWGLARNAAFVIGDRQLTRDCNLDGRVFLHNYDWQNDKDGNLLSNIIAGPATVAQWINLQYYASTVAPHYYGSGNKSTQTVTGGIGVMQGNASDLLAGLPWQSVMKSDEEAFHAPLRLLIIIHAPKLYIKRLLDKSPEFQQKVHNGWLKLLSIDSEGNWQAWS